MRYRATDPNTSTRDWHSLSFDSMPLDLVAADLMPLDEPPSEPDWWIEPSREGADDNGLRVWAQPARADYDEGAEGDGDHATDLAAWQAYEAERDAYVPSEGAPVWGTVWSPSERADADDLDLARASGLHVYEHPIAGVVIGVNGAGYSFFGGHWIPLRARLVCASEYVSRDERVSVLRMLRDEARREGEARRVEQIARAAGIDLTEDQPAAEVAS